MRIGTLFLVAMFVSLRFVCGQGATKPLKITSFTSVQVEVEADMLKTSLVTLVNNLTSTSREYSVVEGNASIVKMGKYDIVEFEDDSRVRVRVVVSDDRLGRDTAYLNCRADSRKIDVSSKYYLHKEEWDRVVQKFAKPISKRPHMAFVEADSNLPNVLIIGTSISMGYTTPVREILKGVANVYRIPENSNSTEISLAKINFWLADVKWDVIHANWGLHDLKYTKGDKAQDVTPVEYKANLRRLLQRLVDTGAKIIWAHTSYVPEGCSPRRDVGDDVLYNNIALEVLKDFPAIVVDDQYTLTKSNPQNQQRNNVHFTPEGYQQQAEQASVFIREALR